MLFSEIEATIASWQVTPTYPISVLVLHGCEEMELEVVRFYGPDPRGVLSVIDRAITDESSELVILYLGRVTSATLLSPLEAPVSMSRHTRVAIHSPVTWFNVYIATCRLNCITPLDAIVDEGLHSTVEEVTIPIE